MRKIVFLLTGSLMLAALYPAVIPADELDCLIEPHEIVSLSSPVDGVLERVYVEKGAVVTKGQVVARLESSLEDAAVSLARARAQMDAAIKSSEARLEFSNVKLARSERLFEKNFISAADLQEAQNEKQLAERAVLNAIENKRLAALQVERATVALSRQTIRSPIDGVVVERFLSPGEYSSGQLKRESPILKIAQIDPLRVEAFAPVSLRGKIASGMTAKVLVEAPAKSSHEARVTIVDPVIDAASSTFRVRLQLSNPNHRISAGLRCKVRFSTSGTGVSKESPESAK